jgi:hypothetical protein
MVTLKFTTEEIVGGRMASDKLADAAQVLHDEGFVVLQDVVDHGHLETLRTKMLEDLEVILDRPDAPFNFNKGNVQQDPPPFPPYLFKDVLQNDLVIAVTESVLGPGLKNSFYSGNTALPGGTRQPVHPDVGQLWPGLTHPTPAFGLVVNIPVVDVTPENGATELWPGTHRDTTHSVQGGSARVTETELAYWRDTHPPIQPSLPLGSVLIRDIRLWHAGMPNHTSIPRPMIAMIHWCSWWNDDGPISFAAGTEEFFQHPTLRTNAHFVDGPIDYLRHGQAYDVQK